MEDITTYNTDTIFSPYITMGIMIDHSCLMDDAVNTDIRIINRFSEVHVKK